MNVQVIKVGNGFLVHPGLSADNRSYMYTESYVAKNLRDLNKILAVLAVGKKPEAKMP